MTSLDLALVSCSDPLGCCLARHQRFVGGGGTGGDHVVSPLRSPGRGIGGRCGGKGFGASGFEDLSLKWNIEEREEDKQCHADEECR